MKSFDSRHAQSMIELTFVVLAVIAGIIMGGPFLTDSINAHFKLWDTAVRDSTNDRLVQAPTNSVVIPDGDCKFDNKAPGDCNSSKCPTPSPTQRYFTYQYNPVGCQVNFSCEDDDTCCTTPIVDKCWRRNDPANATRFWADNTLIPPEVLGKGFFSCAPGGTTCKNGNRLYRISCGAHTDMFIAKDEPDECMPKCFWDQRPKVSIPCTEYSPLQGDGRYMVDDQKPNLLRPTDLCSTDRGACEAKCPPGTFPYLDQCVCSCPDGTWAQGSCGEGYCRQGECPPNYCSIYHLEHCFGSSTPPGSGCTPNCTGNCAPDDGCGGYCYGDCPGPQQICDSHGYCVIPPG